MSRLFRTKRGLAILIVLVIILAGFFIVVFPWIEPSSYHVKVFGRDVIATESKNTEQELKHKLARLKINGMNFTSQDISYADGCYVDTNEAGFTVENWYKGCYGKATLFIASKQPAGQTHNLLLSALNAQANQQTAYKRIPYEKPGCYGPENAGLDEQYRVRGESMQATLISKYHVFDLSTDCGDYVISQTESVYGFLEDISYSSLTKTIDESALKDTLQQQGFQSLVKIALEKEYFNKIISPIHKIIPAL